MVDKKRTQNTLNHTENFVGVAVRAEPWARHSRPREKLEALAAVEVVVDDDVAVALGELAQEVAGGVLGVVAPHLAVVDVGLDDGLGITAMQFGKGHEDGQGVVQAPDEEHALALAGRQVLVEQQQVVAEVEVGLAGVALRQAGSAQVVDARLRHEADVAAQQVDAPTQVNLLHVGEEVLVESARLQVECGAHHQACSAGP